MMRSDKSRNREHIIQHYDLLIEENNDPVHDPEPLKEYMDQWDGQAFIDRMQLDGTQSVLEIGVGTGRLAVRIVPLCGLFCGIDISPKTIYRTKENLKKSKNTALLCGDFLDYDFGCRFDVIYSSLTFMHIADKHKQKAVIRIADWIKPSGWSCDIRASEEGLPNHPVFCCIILQRGFYVHFRTS